MTRMPTGCSPGPCGCPGGYDAFVGAKRRKGLVMKWQGKLFRLLTAIVLSGTSHQGGSVFAALTQEDVRQTVGAVRGYNYGGSRKALLAVEKLINTTHGNIGLRSEIEKELIGVLQSDVSLACKQFVCQKLWIIGTDASVPALANMIESQDSRRVEAACYALSQHSSPAVGRALREALGKARGDGLVAVINLLGDRRDAESAGAIAELAESRDTAAADAAITALGKIATEQAIRVLAKLRMSEDPDRVTAANHAYLQCAQELEAKGRMAAAKAIYAELAASGQPEHVRRAARVRSARVEEAPARSETPGDFTRIEAVPLFDGKTFAGWEGNLDFFRIEDGAIVAGTLKEPIPRNEFLCTTREFGDFELRLKVKLLGDPQTANAGIQVRSRRIPKHHEMIGYQADMGQEYWGNLYDESRRRRVLTTVNQEGLAKVLKHGDWNEYVIQCVGKRIRLWIKATRRSITRNRMIRLSKRE